jgi:hypothetical protein
MSEIRKDLTVPQVSITGSRLPNAEEAVTASDKPEDEDKGDVNIETPCRLL